ncbi:MAG TPA: class I SAM-dependent methyltransferase [Solirubrobacteraceae bacterium]|nr:class I SAM-dependent methyltransferase [Solirubrobacteraceae bacterium]
MDRRLMQTMLDVDEHHWWYRGRREVIDQELARLSLARNTHALDAGCGSGRTLEELSRRCASVAGLELNPEAAEVARGRGDFEIRTGRVEELPWEARSFDLITCLDVIEHTPDDTVALRELRRVSRPGGWLLITVPAYQSLWSTHDEMNHHYRRYSRRRLARAINEAGWQLERMTSFNSLLLVPAALVRVGQRRRRTGEGRYTSELQLPPAWLNRLLELPLRAESRWLAAGRSLPAGLSLLAVARNPAVIKRVPEPVQAERLAAGA